MDEKPKKFILIVDDEEDIRTTIADFFNIENEKPELPFNIVTVLAVDGFDATTRLNNLNFDLVITDYQMPKVEGGRLIQRLRDLTKTRDVPVIVISGHIIEDELTSFRNVRFFGKPFNIQELVDTAILMLSPPRLAGKSPIDIKLLNASVATIKSYLTKMGCSALQMGTPQIVKDKTLVHGAVSTDCHLVTDTFKGSLCFGIDEHLFLYLINKQTGGAEKNIGDGNFKKVSEIGRTLFLEIEKALGDTNFEHSIPSSVIGYRHWEGQPLGSTGMLIPFICAEGKFVFELIAHPR